MRATSRQTALDWDTTGWAGRRMPPARRLRRTAEPGRRSSRATGQRPRHQAQGQQAWQL